MLKTSALIIKKQNLGEVDRIITVLSPDLGKRRLVAKGVRKPLSKLAGHLDTMMLSKVMLTEEDELAKITNADLREPFQPIRDSFALLQQAWAIVGISEKVALENTPQRSLFSLTTDSLQSLALGGRWESVWIYYLANLTKILGLAESYRQCAICSRGLADGCALSGENQVVCLKCCNEFGRLLDTDSLKIINTARCRSLPVFLRVTWQGQALAEQAEEIALIRLAEFLNVPWQNLVALTRLAKPA